MNLLHHIWQISHEMCLTKLDAIDAKPTPPQLARLASATRLLLALHPVDDDGSCRICTPWWRSARRICTVYAAFAHLSSANPDDGGLLPLPDQSSTVHAAAGTPDATTVTQPLSPQEVHR